MDGCRIICHFGACMPCAVSFIFVTRSLGGRVGPTKDGRVPASFQYTANDSWFSIRLGASDEEFMNATVVQNLCC